MRKLVAYIKLKLRTMPYVRYLYKFLAYMKNMGLRAAIYKTRAYLERRRGIKGMTGLKHVTLKTLISPEERRAQERTSFRKNIKISIITPVYNTPAGFLAEMLDSVIGQTYKNWELCLADGSSKDAPGKICMEYAKKDKRIKYKRLSENKGISGNSNAAIEMAEGDYYGLLDHDDLLHPSALFHVMRAICDEGADYIYTDEASFEGDINNLVTLHFKPDFAPDNLRGCAYIAHFVAFSRLLAEGMDTIFRSKYDGSQDHDLSLRLTKKASKVHHVSKLLYYWRVHAGSVASDVSAKPYAIEAGKAAVLSDIQSRGMNATVESAWVCPTFYKIKYELLSRPKVSIIIPNKDSKALLQACLVSVFEKSTYDNYEIIVVENNSTEQETFDYYDEVQARHPQVKVVHWQEKRFNYSEINNFGIEYATGEHIVFMNNDVEIITPDWMEEMLGYSQRPEVGCVGAKLYYPDDTIQHAGVILGLGPDGLAGHIFHGLPRGEVGYMGKLWISQNFSAVTGALMMVRRDALEAAGLLSPCFVSSFCDIDLCLKIRRQGFLVAWTPYAEAYHYESKTRGFHATPEKEAFFKKEIDLFKKIWAAELATGDPYFNANIDPLRSDYSFKASPEHIEL